MKMRKWRVTAWSIIATLALFTSTLITSCQSPDAGTGARDSLTSGSGEGTGKIAGVVIDSEVSLPEGTAAQKYPCVTIKILKAVATGGFSQACESCPKIPSYDAGEIVVEVISGNDGLWEVELPAGKFFIRAFLGEKIYSGDILVEVIKGKTVKLDIKLIHGV